MKIKKQIELGYTNKIKLVLSKTELRMIKIIENLGLIYIYNINFKNGSRSYEVIIRNNKTSMKTKINLFKGISMTNNEISSIKIDSGVINYLFSTDKGILTQIECIKSGIGGKLCARIRTKLY